MDITIGIIQFGLAVALCIQDFTKRTISAILLLTFAISVAVEFFFTRPDIEILPAVATFLLLLFQLLLIKVIFSLIKRGKVKLADGLIGWGDILLLIILCFYLSPVNYFVIYLLSLSLAIIGTASTKLMFTKVSALVPLAGYICLLVCVLKIVEWAFNFNRYDDHWILSILKP